MKRKILVITASGLLSLSVDAHAIQIFKVIEEGLQRVAQSQLQKLEDNVGLLKDQINIEKRIENMTRQSVEHLNKVSDELSGQYNMGKVLNGAAEQAKRRWGPSLNGQGGIDHYQTIKQKHASNFNFRESKEIYSDHSIQSASYNQSKVTQEKAIVSAQYVTSKIDESIREIERLMEEIDRTPNQKASADLNSRIQAQVALELIELKRVQALQLEAMGVMTQQNVIDENMSAQFNRWA